MAAFAMLEPDPLEQADTGKIATVGDAEHLLDAGGGKQDLQGLADRRRGDAATLGRRCQREAEFPAEPIRRDEDTDVADELIGIVRSNAELDPLTGGEQGCCTISVRNATASASGIGDQP
jgi:hypothetical protein